MTGQPQTAKAFRAAADADIAQMERKASAALRPVAKAMRRALDVFANRPNASHAKSLAASLRAMADQMDAFEAEHRKLTTLRDDLAAGFEA